MFGVGATLEDEVVKVFGLDCFDQINKVFGLDCFGQHIWELLLNVIVNKFKHSILNLIMQKMEFYVNVLAPFMQHWILGKAYSLFVGNHQLYRLAHLDLQILQ